jgi:hypothetical protein
MALGLSPEEVHQVQELASRKTDAAETNRINAQIDSLEAQLKLEKDPAVRAQLAEQISMLQMESNFNAPAAYISPGAILQIVQGKAIKPEHAYQTALSHLDQFYHAISDASGDVIKAARSYDCSNILPALPVSLKRQTSKPLKTTFFKNLRDYIYRANREANAKDTASMSGEKYNDF